MKTSALIILCAALGLSACEAPPPAPTDEPSQPAVPAPYVPVTPIPASGRLNWERLDTINNCHIYVLAYGDRTYLLATSSEGSRSSSGPHVACALAPAGQ